MSRRQGIFWILTISCAEHPLQPILIPELCWIRGQQERGDGGFLHWQVIIAFHKKASSATLRRLYPGINAELTRSAAAAEYVWKEDTRVPGSQFEIGVRPICRNSKVEWEKIWQDAIKGDLLSIPANIRVQNYRTLRCIQSDFARPIGINRTCSVFHGPTGTGKSMRAWEEGTLDAYPKDPRSKFWCGYNGQTNVIIDEFRGGIDISHLLRWLDRYPVNVEIKGSSVCLQASHIWITSNLRPELWYPDLDPETLAALLRRLVVVEF